MKLQELIKLRSENAEQMEALLNEAEISQRNLNEEEVTRWNELKEKDEELTNQINIRKEQDEINKRSVITEINNKKEKTQMRKFNEIIVRNNGNVENFKVRAIELASGIYDESVKGDLSVVGYEPFYKAMGVEVMPNLKEAIKLPYVEAMIAGKVSEGNKSDNNKAVSTVLLSPERYTITETVGKELLSVGNEAALQAFIYEMVKGCDRAVTKDIFTQVLATATAIPDLTGYTTTNLDTLVGAVDGNGTVLMPRAEFYKAKGEKVDTGSGLFLANKTGEFTGTLWDGTPLFYSNLFTGSAIAVADLKHITVGEFTLGEFGDEYEVIIDQYSKAPEGQVKITVAKLASVKVRNANAVKKAIIA